MDAGVDAVAAKLRESSDDGDTMRSCAPFLNEVDRHERWALYSPQRRSSAASEGPGRHAPR